VQSAAMGEISARTAIVVSLAGPFFFLFLPLSEFGIHATVPYVVTAMVLLAISVYYFHGESEARKRALCDARRRIEALEGDAADRAAQLNALEARANAASGRTWRSGLVAEGS
jgi:hypothetical protein